MMKQPGVAPQGLTRRQTKAMREGVVPVATRDVFPVQLAAIRILLRFVPLLEPDEQRAVLAYFEQTADFILTNLPDPDDRAAGGLRRPSPPRAPSKLRDHLRPAA